MRLMVNNRFTSCPAGPGSGASVGMGFLLGEQGVVDLVGNADAAGLGERFGVLLAQERAPYPDRMAAAERPVALAVGTVAGHARSFINLSAGSEFQLRW